jgi:hypothetical protein
MSGRTEDISGLKGENRRGNWEAPRTTLTHMICLALALACFLLGGILWTSRHYKTKPTRGIGRYRHLVKVQEVRGKSCVKRAGQGSQRCDNCVCTGGLQ